MLHIWLRFLQKVKIKEATNYVVFRNLILHDIHLHIPEISNTPQIGTRGAKYFQKLTDEIRYIDAKFYASDHWHAYNSIDLAKHLTGEAHTYTVELMNRLLRHYLARFTKKTYCYSKSLQMIKYSLLLFMHRDFIECIKI